MAGSKGCPREDLPPSALEGGACEAGGPGPRGGFLLPHVPSPQRLPCPPAPARHLMTGLNSPNPLSKGAIRAYGLSLPASSGLASDDALSILRTMLFRLPSPEKGKRLRSYVLTGLLLFVKTILKSRDCGQRKSRAIRPAFSLPIYLEGDFCRLRPGSR